MDKNVDKEAEEILIARVSEIERNTNKILGILVGERTELNGVPIVTPGLMDKINQHGERIDNVEAKVNSHIAEVAEAQKKKEWLSRGMVAGAGVAGVGMGAGIKAFIAWIISIFV